MSGLFQAEVRVDANSLRSARVLVLRKDEQRRREESGRTHAVGIRLGSKRRASPRLKCHAAWYGPVWCRECVGRRSIHPRVSSGRDVGGQAAEALSGGNGNGSPL